MHGSRRNAVGYSFVSRDFHPLPRHQFAWRSKSARILDILANSRHPLSFAEIVKKSGFVKSSTHRILATLQNEGLVDHDSRSRKYRLGPRLVVWARAAWRRTDIQLIAATELEALSEQTAKNVALSIRDDDSVLYLRTIDAVPVPYAATMGDHAPLHCTAVGKVYLAFLSDAVRGEVLGRLRFERFTENSIQTVEALEVDLAETRARGYGIANREEFLHVIGIAAPIRNGQGQVVAGVSLWTLAEKTTLEAMKGHASSLLEATCRISHQLGYGGF